MDSRIHDFEENQLFNDKSFLNEKLRLQSDRLSFVPKSGKSEVWNRFVRVYYNNIKTDYAKCIFCEVLLKQNKESGTSGLLKHRCPQRIEPQEEDSKQEVFTSFIHQNNAFDESLAESTAESPLECRDFYVSALHNCDPLVSLRRQRGKSSIWDRFERIFYNNCETKFVKCKHCDSVHTHTNNFDTTALLKHSCGIFGDNSLIEDQDYEELLEDNPLNDKIMIKEMIKNNDQRISFVREKKKSEVWNRFERIFIDDFQTLYVKCKYCECVQKQTLSGGTQGLRRHRCPSLKGNALQDTTHQLLSNEEKSDSNYDEVIEDISINDEKEYIKHLTEENNTLRQIVEKCLKIIDRCLCVNKYNSKQRQEVNLLVNKYNQFSIPTKTFENKIPNEDNTQTNDEFLVSKKPTFSSNRRLGPNVNNNRILLSKQKLKRRQQMTNSIKNKYQKKYLCDWSECGQRFRLEKHLTEHRNVTHLNIKSHECQWPGCEEKFLRKGQLNVHVLKYHSKGRFNCDQCSFEAPYKSFLRIHQRIHGKEKFLSCDWPGCDFRTNHEKVLKDHKKTHSGERPYQCSWPSCEWSFRQKHHLRAHMLKHTGEKPIKCESIACDRRFTSRQAMRFHMDRVHK